MSATTDATAAESEVLDESEAADFDFELHGERAAALYQPILELHEQFASVVESVLKTCLQQKQAVVHSVESRAKSVESFLAKCKKASATDPGRPKYEDPLTQIEDLAAARVISTFSGRLRWCRVLCSSSSMW